METNQLLNNFTEETVSFEDGTYAMKKVLIQNNDHLELVKEEIRVSSLWSHRNLLPLFDHAIIPVKGTPEQSWTHEAYLLFPVHLDGTLLENTTTMKSRKELFSTSVVFQIFRRVTNVQYAYRPDTLVCVISISQWLK